jgi:transposase
VALVKYRKPDRIKKSPGRPVSGKQPKEEDLRRLYVEEARSIREVAQFLAVPKDTVARALKKYRIPARPNASRSRLRCYSLSGLQADIKAKGIRGLARELGIAEGTIRHHLKIRRDQ